MRSPYTSAPRLGGTQLPKWLLLINAVMALVYFAALVFWFPHGNPYLFGVFIAGEVFHLWQTFTYAYTVWDLRSARAFDRTFTPSVDVFITVAGEPVAIVSETIRAVKAMTYPRFRVYILNDGKVAGKDNWREMEALAAREGVTCITRQVPGGAKAGNINHALRHTAAPFVAIFDADHVPHKDFLAKMMGYFADERMGFVQSPQYYHNAATNYITGGAWEQQELFFGPIMQGKNRSGAAFMCGTNMVIRRAALAEVGGMCETNIAEDFLTSLFLHERRWRSTYMPEVLAEGLAPEDFLSYYKQQFRWARGSLEVIFKYNPLFRRGLSWQQKLQYLTSASYYLSGPVTLMNALLPIVFLFTGVVVFKITTMELAIVFLPYIFLSVYVLQLSSSATYTYRALAFSSGSFWLQLQALGAVLTNQKTGFAVTSKQRVNGNFIHLALPQIGYLLLVIIGTIVAVLRQGWDASVVTNLSWALLTAALFLPIIMAASPAGGKPNPSAQRVRVQPAASPRPTPKPEPEGVTHA